MPLPLLFTAIYQRAVTRVMTGQDDLLREAFPKHPVQEPLFLQTQPVSVTLLTIVFSVILNLNPQLPSNEDSLEGLMLKLKL